MIKRGSAMRRIEATSWGSPPSLSSFLLDLSRAIPLFSPSPPGRLLCNGVRMSGWPRLRALSKGIYIRPNHIKQRLGVFTAHCKKRKNRGGKKEEGGFPGPTGFTIGIAVKWRKRNVLFMEGKGVEGPYRSCLKVM